MILLLNFVQDYKCLTDTDTILREYDTSQNRAEEKIIEERPKQVPQQAELRKFDFELYFFFFFCNLVFFSYIVTSYQCDICHNFWHVGNTTLNTVL